MSFSPEDPKEGRVTASIGNIIVFFANSVGLSADIIREKTGIDTLDLMDPDAYLSEDCIVKLFILLVETFPDKNISLELARVAPLTYFGSPWRYLRHAPDVRTLVDMAIRNISMFSNQLSIESIDSPGERIFRLYHPMDEIDGGVGAEVAMGLTTRFLREYFDDKALSRVQFRHEPRGDVSVYEDFFGGPVAFRKDFNALILRAEALDSPNKKVRPKIKTSIERSLRHLRLELYPNDADEIEDIRKAIASNTMKGDYSVSGLAETMKISLSHLQRRMKISKVSARDLLEEIRHANALELLSDESLSVEEIAESLGFNDERSFRRAFQRWTDKSPAQFRKEVKNK